LFSRQNISRFAALALASCGSISTLIAQASTPAPPRAVVYTVHNPKAIDDYRTNPAVVRAMVDRLLIAVTGQPDVVHAWRSLVSPDDKVGIKISAAGGELFTTHRDVVNAIADGLVASGLPRDRIIVWDRQLDGIKGAGYRVGGEGYQLADIPPRDGYDPTAEFIAPTIGKLIWGDVGFIPHKGANPIRSDDANSSTVSHFARIVTQRITKIINVPVLSDSSLAGIAGSLYNVTLPNVDNWRRFTQYGGFGASGIGDLYNDERIRGKVVLHIMDGLLATYAGGPAANPNYATHEATLLASKDPVALDTIALARLEELRARANLPGIGEGALHVPLAGENGVGIGDRARIEVRNLR